MYRVCDDKEGLRRNQCWQYLNLGFLASENIIKFLLFRPLVCGILLWQPRKLIQVSKPLFDHILLLVRIFWYAFVWVHVCVCVCIDIYTHTHTYILIYICVYLWTNIVSLLPYEQK